MRVDRPVLKTLLAVALSIGAIAIAIANLRERLHQPPIPDDGVVWVDTDAGVMAEDVRPESPASNAGIRRGQLLRYIYHDGAYEEIHRGDDVGFYLDEA